MAELLWLRKARRAKDVPRWFLFFFLFHPFQQWTSVVVLQCVWKETALGAKHQISIFISYFREARKRTPKCNAPLVFCYQLEIKQTLQWHRLLLLSLFNPPWKLWETFKSINTHVNMFSRYPRWFQTLGSWETRLFGASSCCDRWLPSHRTNGNWLDPEGYGLAGAIPRMQRHLH